MNKVNFEDLSYVFVNMSYSYKLFVTTIVISVQYIDYETRKCLLVINDFVITSIQPPAIS